MINKYNIGELSLVDRPVPGPAHGFGSVTNKFVPGHDRVWRDTSNGLAYGYGQILTAEQEIEKFNNIKATKCGLKEPRPMAQQGVRCIAGLTGEHYKEGDPQKATNVQRAWLPQTDPSVRFMQEKRAANAQ